MRSWITRRTDEETLWGRVVTETRSLSERRPRVARVRSRSQRRLPCPSWGLSGSFVVRHYSTSIRGWSNELILAEKVLHRRASSLTSTSDVPTAPRGGHQMRDRSSGRTGRSRPFERPDAYLNDERGPCGYTIPNISTPRPRGAAS